MDARKVKLFRETIFLYAYEVKTMIEMLADMIKNIGKPTILDTCGLDVFELELDGFYNEPLFEHDFGMYIASLAKEGDDYLGKILNVCEEDIEWGNWRNKNLTGKYYYKLTLKPEYQKVAVDRLNGFLIELEKIKEEMALEEAKVKEAKEQRRSQFSIGKIYKDIKPKGGENGQDGYFDAEFVSNQTNISVRFVARNVFDFGYYAYPKRLEGTNDIFDTNKWSENEKAISKWLYEFSPFTTTVRM